MLPAIDQITVEDASFDSAQTYGVSPSHFPANFENRTRRPSSVKKTNSALRTVLDRNEVVSPETLHPLEIESIRATAGNSRRKISTSRYYIDPRDIALRSSLANQIHHTTALLPESGSSAPDSHHGGPGPSALALPRPTDGAVTSPSGSGASSGLGHAHSNSPSLLADPWSLVRGPTLPGAHATTAHATTRNRQTISNPVAVARESVDTRSSLEAHGQSPLGRIATRHRLSNQMQPQLLQPWSEPRGPGDRRGSNKVRFFLFCSAYYDQDECVCAWQNNESPNCCCSKYIIKMHGHDMCFVMSARSAYE